LNDFEDCNEFTRIFLAIALTVRQHRILYREEQVVLKFEEGCRLQLNSMQVFTIIWRKVIWFKFKLSDRELERTEQMSSIKPADNSPKFIPINYSDNNRSTDSITDLANANPEFQKALQDLLHSLTTDVRNSSQNNLENSLAAILNQNAAAKLPWSQSLQAGSFTGAPNGASDPLTNFAYALMIAKYKTAMANFKNALQSYPGSMGDLNMDTLSQTANPTQEAVPASGAYLPGINPTKQQVVDYIYKQCREIGIPERLGLATASTESEMTQFNKDGTPYRHSNPGSTDWGIMQINDKAWGERYDLDRIKTDWQYNVRAGLEILKYSYDAAVKNGEGDKGPGVTIQNLARAAYSGYNAGVANVWRYRTPVHDATKTGSYDVLNNEGYDLRDIRFWDNYRRFL
jgi:hypothetical protein